MNTPDSNAQISPPSTILVTGGTGFLGAYIIRDLIQAGYRVRALRRKPSLPQYIDASILNQAEWIECDLFDLDGLAEAVDGATAVIHSAAVVSFRNSESDSLMRTNVEGTENIVNVSVEHNVSRFVHVSSVAALGKSMNGELVTESSPWKESKRNTVYAVSKYNAEMHVWRGIAEGLNAVIVNPSTILGYGNWNSSSTAIFRKVYSGFPWFSTGGTGFVDVEDVSRAIIQLMATNIHSERFILNGENWSYRKLLETIADGFNIRRPNKEAGPFVAGVAWRMEKLRSLFTGTPPLLTAETARISRSHSRYDNSKIKSALPGFTFANLEQTIKQACGRYLAEIQQR